MEIAKPKTKKKSKTKPEKSTHAEPPPPPPPPPSTITLSDIDVDIEFPSSSSSSAAATLDSLPTRECSVAAELQAFHLEDAIADNASNYEAVAAPEESAIDPPAATAPPPLDLHADTEAMPSAPDEHCPAVRYPDLHSMQRELHALPDVRQMAAAAPRMELTRSVPATSTTSAAARLQPFTRQQMRQIYVNPELERAAEYESEFVRTELSADRRLHPVHDLLAKYWRCRQTLRINRVDVAGVRQHIDQLAPRLWRREQRTVRYQATCADSVVVRGSEQYDFIAVDETAFEQMSSHLGNLLNLVSYNCALNLYLAETHKLQITQIVQQLTADATTVPPPQRAEHRSELRTVISIFFNFLRRPLPDQSFGDDAKAWLRRLVAQLLRDAAWPDRMFLTLHVMRCPAGLADWAAAFVQLPRPDCAAAAAVLSHNAAPFASVAVLQCVAFLRALLRPVDGRTEFLRQNIRPRTTSENPVDPVKEDVWILVDSDGDEGGSNGTQDAADAALGEILKEKDLIALLNQMPLEQLFGAITLARRTGSSYAIEAADIDAPHLLRLIGFANDLVQLVGDGLRTYNTERYRQFAKLLGRLIRHTVVYVAESYALFKRAGHAIVGLSVETHARLGCEFDVFVLRAADFIYRSRCLGAWQYLALLPFGELRTETVWRLYYFLGVGGADGVVNGNGEDDWQSMAQAEVFLRQFSDTVVDVPAEDMYYLLQTFGSIAQSRKANGPGDRELIESIMLDLFEIGFVNATTSETSYKIVRDLLANITDETPDLLSVLLERTKLRFKAISSATSAAYLFKALPLGRWLPTERDFEIAATWLLHNSYESAESALARTIFGRLNWQFADANGDATGDERLHLCIDLHVRMACLLCEVAAKLAPETVGLSGITESVRQVSSLVKGSSTPQQLFVAWCWNMVTVLRLHGMDQGREARARWLRQPAQMMARVPELERLGAVFQGVTDGRPLALYVAVLATQCGHSVPLVCHRGFAQMARLLQDYRQSAVVRCLELVTPLFVECPESLSKCDAFQSILGQLLNADKTYMKMAKDLIANDYPGPVVELLGQMIQCQCVNHVHYAFVNPLPLCMLWLECLTATAAWHRDTNAVYLVDVVLRVAWQMPDMWSVVKEFFRYNCTKNGGVTSSTASFLPALLSGLGSGAGAMLAMLPAVTPNTMWMALLTLELEHEMLERQSGVWSELLRQLRAVPASTRFSLDGVLKASAAAVQCTHAPTAATLVLYKYVQLMLASRSDHELLPIVAQRFFQLYLARVPLVDDEQRHASVFGVADKFYEHNVGLMKRLKRHLAQAEADRKSAGLTCDDEAMAAFQTSCSRIFGTYGLWLEETRLNELASGCSAQQFGEFPPQYETQRLRRIFAGDESYWTDFVHMPSIRDQQRADAQRWQRSCFRLPPTASATAAASRRKSSTIARNSPAAAAAAAPTQQQQNIARLLSGYDAPLPAPAIDAQAAILPPIEDTQRLLGMLRGDFAQLERTARDFHTAVQELNFTDCNYKDLVRVLYSNRSQRCERSLQCASLLSSNSCRGARSVTISITEPTIDARIENKIARNREKHELNVERQLAAPPVDAVIVFVRIQHYVRHILASYAHLLHFQPQRHAELCSIASVGIAFFYEIVNGMSEFADAFPPANELLGDVLAQLGTLIRDNQSGEGVRLLETALRRPHLLQLLADMFTPSATAPVYFLDMYQFVVDSHMQKRDVKILFVLLSKFDVAKWLVAFMPKLVDITRLLKIIVQGLESWNQPDAALVQGVLRRHLVHIFQYDFPEHYGEVLQAVLAGSSDQRLLPTVLAELLQSIFQLAATGQHHQPQTGVVVVVVEAPSIEALLAIPPDAVQQQQLRTAIGTFAAGQQLFGFKAVQDTLAMLAQHFRNERMQHGLHGLYPKHRDHCGVLAVLLRSYAQALVVSTVVMYPGLLADRLLDWLWPPLADTFGPWLVPYFPHAAQQPAPANWIRQVLANNDALLPWSELYTREAQLMADTFGECVLYVLETLPGSEPLLGHVLLWYETHFAYACVGRTVLGVVHAALRRLPWERLQPQAVHVECTHRALLQFLPDAHAFLGHVFVRVDWSAWLRRQWTNEWDVVGGHHAQQQQQQRVLGALLQVFTKLSFEPNVREGQQHAQLVRMLREAAAFPWSLLAPAAVAPVFDGLVLMAEPSMLLTTLNAERQHEAVDAAVLSILQMASCMHLTTDCSAAAAFAKDKRIVYVKTIVRLLRLCGSKNQQLLVSAEGATAFRVAVQQLLDLIDNLAAGRVGSGEDALLGRGIGQRDTNDLMAEVVGSLQQPGEFTSKIFVEALTDWQCRRKITTPLLAATLSAIGTCKTYTNNVIGLLEATLFHYFRLNSEPKRQQPPSATTAASSSTAGESASWLHVVDLLNGRQLPAIEGADLVQRHHLLTLHAFTVSKLSVLTDVGEQLTLLQRLHLILEPYKTSEATEPKLLALWSLMIAFGVQRLRHSDTTAKQLLLTLGRFLQSASVHPDGWGDGVLGAFGLRRDGISNRRRLATRCLACVVFSLFPDAINPTIPCKEYTVAIEELTAQVQSKRYADIRADGQLAIELVRTQRNATAAIASGADFETPTTQSIGAVLRLFYKDASYLASLDETWLHVGGQREYLVL